MGVGEIAAPAGLERSRPRWRRRRSILQNRALTQVMVVAGLALAWEIIGQIQQSPLIPPVTSVLAAWGSLLSRERFQSDLFVTVQTLLAGYGAAIVSGVLVGAMMGRFRIAKNVFDPFLNAFNSAPHAALVPIIMLLFGIGISARIVVVFLYGFFIIAITTTAGLRNTDRQLLDMARTFGAGSRQTFLKVALPAALPLILGGIRLAGGRVAGGVLLAEMLTALTGLGYQMSYYGGSFQTTYVLAIVATITTMGLIMTETTYFLERRFTSWNRR